MSVTQEQATRERLDDIRAMLADAGFRDETRASLTRVLIFALPLDSADHIDRIVRLGWLRLMEDCGRDFSGDTIAEAEGLLGWYAEDASRADLVRELAETRREIALIRWSLKTAYEKFDELMARRGPTLTEAEGAAGTTPSNAEDPSPIKEKEACDAWPP